ncbi:MAG: HAMP domain-containing histidine kinase [Clostridia bacterium]|nr:HAMP domain-containing histidine kinase [Clostridia bacterium]
MKKRRSPLAEDIVKSFQDIKLSKGLSRWLLIQTLLLIGVAVFTTFAIDWISVAFAETPKPDPYKIISIVASLIVVLGIFEILQYSLVKRHLKKICDAIERIAHGDYGYKIKPSKIDIFKSLAYDINLLSEELESVQMLRNDFVNSYSHEYKTPIASIKGFAQLLLEDDNIPEETRKQYLQIIVDESERLAGLAGNTALLSQLDTITFITDNKPYLLDEQLRRCTIMLAKDISEKNIKLDGSGINTVTFCGNEDWLQHLWLNLLHNAVKFTPDGGTISVASHSENGRIFVSITDSGIGMTQKTADQIFKKYYRANTKDPQRGLGLGLNIAQKIVKLYNGRISVKSELGKGTTFTVELPQ